MSLRLARAGVTLGAVAFLVPGVWSLLWPRSFHRHVALFDPFNLHLFHDLGAFQISVGLALLGALLWRDAISVALLGASASAVLHTASHLIDSDLGGRASDPWGLGLLTTVLTSALVLQRRAQRRASPEEQIVARTPPWV